MSKKILATLKGDIYGTAGDRIKYGLMFDVLRDLIDIVDIHDASLKGIHRITNLIQTFRPNKQAWREYFYKNPMAFEERSRQTAAYIQQHPAPIDLIFQVGVLFDSRWQNTGPASVIYTDYTAQLSRLKRDAGRSPLNDAQMQVWLDLERQAYEHASHICTRAEYVRQSIIRDYGIPADKVTAIGGGPNLLTLPTLPPKTANDAPVVLFIGKDFYRKGGDILLQAWAKIHQSYPAARLVMITEMDESAPVQLPGGVQVVPPTWDRQIIDAYYRQADVFVLPSRLETWGDVLLEAMAYALPCVGVYGDGMSEIIEHERTGLMVPAQDAPALADALARLLDDPNKRREWGCNGRIRLEEKFTWQIIMQQVATILNGIPS